jgi:hypothetical protein
MIERDKLKEERKMKYLMLVAIVFLSGCTPEMQRAYFEGQRRAAYPRYYPRKHEIIVKHQYPKEYYAPPRSPRSTNPYLNGYRRK